MVRYWKKMFHFVNLRKSLFNWAKKKVLVWSNTNDWWEVKTSLLILINLQSVIETFTFNHSRGWLGWWLSTTDHLSGWLPLRWRHHPAVHSWKSVIIQWLWNQKWQKTYWLMIIWDDVSQNNGKPMYKYPRRYCAATCMLFGTVSRLGQHRKTLHEIFYIWC